MEKLNKNFIIKQILPYYITTPIIEKIIKEEVDVKKMVFMVQKEVGERFASKPNTREYGSITVFLNYYFNIKQEFIVGRKCFNPSPNVDSMVISLNQKSERIKVDMKKFDRLVRDSFQFKRKNLRNNLKNYDLDKINEILSKYNLDITHRAEELDYTIFVDLCNNLF
jgi:16S rRNA (adenine1518-N6/adenine1519-N6)-dimethyltransferase